MIACLCWGIVGCQTTVSDPSKAATTGSTAAFLFGYDELKKYLDERRQVLSQLDHKIANLDDQLLSKIVELRRMEEDMIEAQAKFNLSDRDRQELQTKIDNLQRSADETYQEILQSKADEQRLKQEKLSSEEAIAADQQRIQNLQSNVNSLEGDLGALDSAIEATNNLRERQILRTEKGI